jgi:hypothetical protein
MGDNLPVVDFGTGKTAVAVFPGTWHTCALLNDNSVKCWGNNNNGNLGPQRRCARGSRSCNGQRADRAVPPAAGTGVRRS